MMNAECRMNRKTRSRQNTGESRWQESPSAPLTVSRILLPYSAFILPHSAFDSLDIPNNELAKAAWSNGA